MDWTSNIVEISALFDGCLTLQELNYKFIRVRARLNKFCLLQRTNKSIKEIFGIAVDEIVNICKRCYKSNWILNDAKSLFKPKNKEKLPNLRTTLQNHFIFHEFIQKTLETHQKMQIKLCTIYRVPQKFTAHKLIQRSKNLEFFFKFYSSDEYVYSHHKHKIGRTKQNFQVSLCEFKQQRPCRLPLHFRLREKLVSLKFKLKPAGILRELNEQDNLNNWFVIPIIVLPKNDYTNLVIDTCYLNSITNTSKSIWLLEPLSVSLTPKNEIYLTISDLSYLIIKYLLQKRFRIISSFCWRTSIYTSSRMLRLPAFFELLKQTYTLSTSTVYFRASYHLYWRYATTNAR